MIPTGLATHGSGLASTRCGLPIRSGLVPFREDAMVRATELHTYSHGYKVWANRQVLASVEWVPADQLSVWASISHGNLRGTLAHI